MDIVGAVTSILSCLCAKNCVNESIGQQCVHLKRPKMKLGKLIRNMEELSALAVDVKIKLEQMQMQDGLEPSAGVKLWLNNVEKIENEVSSLVNKDRQGGPDRRYANHLCSRIKLGEVIEETIKEVAELIDKAQFPDDLIAKKLLKRGYTLPITRLVENSITMQSLMKIWEYLMDHEVGRIGVYGMGGVGKTTIMKEINNRLLKATSHFDCVIWVTVPKESSLEKLQDEVAKKVNVDLSQCEDVMQRGAELSNVLRRRKRFVLILDDMWSLFPLEEVGIPIPTVENGCKLVITTRLPTICRDMETDREVEVKTLSENEALDLFRDKVGEQVLLLPDIQIIARNVVEECGGLPLAIITVGRALRKTTDISEWENALTELRSSTANIGRMEEVVFARLRFSFANLRDDTSRSCFLYCALYPEGHKINANELIDYWMWEGLLGDVWRIQANKQKGKIILNELKNACLLESVTEYGIEYVKMHDLIRDMAISITSTRPRCIIKAGIGLRNAPGRDEWTEDVERVSLMINNVETIPFDPGCPKLTSLLLQHNSFSQNLPHSFFDYMPGLKVLNLSYTGLKFLPRSLSNLENLCTLLITNCWNLRILPSLVKLVKLRVLDLSCSSGIKEFPYEMEQLCNLRRLNLSYTSIGMFPAGSLPMFTLLEEFSMVGVNLSWGSTIEEVIGARYLTMLELSFWDLDVFDYYVRSGHWEQLENYKFMVGYATDDFHGNRSVAIGGCFLLRGSPILLPTNSREMHLEYCTDIVRLSMCLSSVMQLKTCIISDCSEMESIVKSGENNLSTLERMKLVDLENLRMICEGVMEPLTLSSLKIIEVERCDNLKCLFLGGMLQQLQNLEEIIVSKCTRMEHIMLDDRGADNAAIITFPRLQKLKLHELPELKSIYNEVIVCDALQSIEVWSCNALKRLPLALGVDPVQQLSPPPALGGGPVQQQLSPPPALSVDPVQQQLSPPPALGVDPVQQLSPPPAIVVDPVQQQLSPPPALKEIKGTIDWWESLAWDTPDAKIILQPYFLEYENMASDDSSQGRPIIMCPASSSAL